MLCYPRILGYVFNPLTVFFCYDTADKLGAIIYEVHNTFKERHAYVLPVTGTHQKSHQTGLPQSFCVSPFVPMTCHYDFRLSRPGTRLGLLSGRRRRRPSSGGGV